MSEFEDKLNTILSNPEMMGQIMGFARSLGGGAPTESQSEHPPLSTEKTPPTSGDLLSQLGSIDPKFLDMAVRMMNAYGSGDDRRTALLTALRPFIREERYAKLDQAIRITKLTRAVRIALDTLRSREGGSSLV